MSTYETPEIASLFGALDSATTSDGRALDAHVARVIASNSNRHAAKGEHIFTIQWPLRTDANSPDDHHRFAPTTSWSRLLPEFPIHYRRGLHTAELRVNARISREHTVYLQCATKAQPFARDAGGANVLEMTGTITAVVTSAVSVTSNVATATVSIGHGITAGQVIYTQGLTVDVDEASPSTVSSVTATTIVYPVTACDGAMADGVGSIILVTDVESYTLSGLLLDPGGEDEIDFRIRSDSTEELQSTVWGGTPNNSSGMSTFDTAPRGLYRNGVVVLSSENAWTEYGYADAGTEILLIDGGVIQDRRLVRKVSDEGTYTAIHFAPPLTQSEHDTLEPVVDAFELVRIPTISVASISLFAEART